MVDPFFFMFWANDIPLVRARRFLWWQVSLSVVAVHRSVRVKREAFQHRDASCARSRSLDEAQALLNGALLQLLVVLLGPRRIEVRPVLLRRSQHTGQNAHHVFVAGSGHRHHRSVVLPQRLSHEQMEVWSELELTSQPPPEADATSCERARKRRDAGPHRVASATRPSPAAPARRLSSLGCLTMLKRTLKGRLNVHCR